MTHHRIERLLEDGNLEEVQPDPGDVVGLWKKASERWRDYQTGDLSPGTAFEVVYTAGFQVARAVLRAEGYRARGRAGGGHHWSTFYALRGLGHKKIAAVAVKLDAARSLRHESLYDPTGQVTDEELRELADAVEALFELARDYVCERIPDVDGTLPLP